MSYSFPHVKIFRLEQFTSKSLENGPKTSQNNIGWLFSARAVLSMIFSGYSCSADPFARYRAGQFSPVLVRGRKLPTKSRITLKFCPKTTLAGCIAPAKSFQHYLLGTGLLRTRSRDSVLLVNGASARRLFCIAPSVGRCWRWLPHLLVLTSVGPILPFGAAVLKILLELLLLLLIGVNYYYTTGRVVTIQT